MDVTRQQASTVRMMFRVRPWTTAALACVLCPVWSQPVEPPSEVLEAVIVTGSRIPRLELDRLQPTVVVTRDALESRGVTNVVDVLSDIPAFGPPASSAAGLQSSSFAVAQSYADFLSLGSQRTLTLVNGRRFVSSNTASIFGPVNLGQQVDLNAIPTKLIDRLEVVAVGGAPVYGSDAIAGTVNLILRRDFEGFDLDVLMGRSERGDGDNQRFRVLAGTNFAQDRGNVTINAEYLHSDGLVYMDRPSTARGLFYAPPLDPGSLYANELIESRRIPVINTGGLPMTADLIAHFAGIRDASGNVMQFGPDGALVPYAFGTATGSLASASGGDGLDLNTVSNLLSPTQRANFTLLGNFRVSERVNAYGEGWYSTTNGTRLASQPSFNALVFGPAGTPDGNLIFSVDNPFLPEASRRLIIDNLLAAGADPSVFYLARANTDIQTGVARSETNLYRAVAGIEGSFEIGAHSFHWDISANYGNSQTSSREPQIVQQNFENALDAVLDAATGAVVCRGTLDGTLVSAPIETASAECAALNLFGHGSPSKAARDYITTQARQTSRNSQRVIAANISGDVVDLPAGPVNAVLGLESRRETSEFDPDRFYREAWGRLVAIEGLRGEFETEEVFTELLIPLVGKGQGIPFVHALQVEGAARYVDHSIAGGDLTWTAGGRFAPVPDIQFRGNKTRAIRSPAITEAFLPISNAFATANDPCDVRFIGSGPDPTTRASNCAAAGITQPFLSYIVDAGVRITVSGDQELRNEEADSQTWGVVLRPRWLPSLSLSVDWIVIDLTDAIVNLNAETVLETCYDSSLGIDSTALCGNIDRDSSGQVTFVRTGYANAASTRLKALSAQLSYGADLGRFGWLDTSLNFYNLRNLTSRIGHGDVDHDAGEIGLSRERGTLTVDYRVRDFSLSLQAEYTGPARWDVDEPVSSRDVGGVGEWWVFDLSAGYRFNENLTARLFIDNLFDRGPPFPVPADGGVVAYFDGIFGRSYAVSFNYTL